MFQKLLKDHCVPRIFNRDPVFPRIFNPDPVFVPTNSLSLPGSGSEGDSLYGDFEDLEEEEGGSENEAQPAPEEDKKKGMSHELVSHPIS